MIDGHGITASGETTRPRGPLSPVEEVAARTFAAIRFRRWDEAARHAKALPDSSTEQAAWRALLRGWLEIERGQTVDAEPWLHRAITLSWIAALRDQAGRSSDHTRLASLSLHQWGRALRRQDRPDEAEDAHRAAFRLREQVGSFDELAETAIEIGLDLAVSEQHEEAIRWFDRAIDSALRADDGLVLEAAAHTHRSTSLAELERTEEAVEAARTAQSLLRRHDAGSSAVAMADARLGSVLLKRALALCEESDPGASAVLEDSIAHLERAREALMAFGTDFADDARWCGEQLRFAEQLGAQVATT